MAIHCYWQYYGDIVAILDNIPAADTDLMRNTITYRPTAMAAPRVRHGT